MEPRIISLHVLMRFRIDMLKQALTWEIWSMQSHPASASSLAKNESARCLRTQRGAQMLVRYQLILIFSDLE
jgi:hypothetical protein